MLLPPVHRHLPRSRPGTGPTSRSDIALRAEVTHLTAEVTRLIKEQDVQFRRIADIQRQLDEIQRTLTRLLNQK
jgi:hypothetical protein